MESGGDNLTATFSPALVDAQIFVLDVAGGGDVARKGGPGIGRADLLVVNKTDLGPLRRGGRAADGRRRPGGPRRAAGARRCPGSTGPRSTQLTGWVRGVLTSFRSGTHVAVDPGPMAPHIHADEGGAAHVHRHDDDAAGHGTSTATHDARAHHARRAHATRDPIGVRSHRAGPG